MKIAVTRLSGKEKSDAERCARAGHNCYSVHPLRSELRDAAITEFVKGAERNAYDCIFFTSALPAKIIAPLLKQVPRVIAIGPQTAKELELLGIGCETLPGFYSRDFVPYLGDWIMGKHIGIPRADVPNPALIEAITAAGGIVHEFRCYGLEPTRETLALDAAEAILFTSAMSFTKAIWTPRRDLLVMAIGDITAAAMRTEGTVPAIVGDGSLEGTLAALNKYLDNKGTNNMELPNAEPEHPEPKKKAPLWKGAGIIVVDKTQGPSSHEIAAWVGQMLGCDVGHSGTLDPQVSGLLLIMLGNAVRLAPLLLTHDKEYVCLMRLHGDVDPACIQKMGEEFTGRLYQRPPRKSAVKRNLRIRTIHKLEILSIEGRLVLFRVNCEAGTYIRSLCHHMGFALGVGGHMQELRRTRSGTFDETTMHTLHELKDACVVAETGDRAALESMVISVDAAVPDLPVVTVRDAAIDAICRGAVLAGVGVISCDEFGKNQTVAVLSQKREFICLGKALIPSSSFKPGETGLVIAPTSVFLQPGTYPRGWTKSDKPVHHEKKPAKKPVQKPARRTSVQFQRKRYH